MKRICLLLAVFWPQIAAAQDWVPLRDDVALMDVLAGRIVQYDPLTMQRFGKLGDTQFITERAADGRWLVQDGQYCAVWPPSEVWACYDVAVAGDRVQFTGADGTASEGTLRE